MTSRYYFEDNADMTPFDLCVAVAERLTFGLWLMGLGVALTISLLPLFAGTDPVTSTAMMIRGVGYSLLNAVIMPVGLLCLLRGLTLGVQGVMHALHHGLHLCVAQGRGDHAPLQISMPAQAPPVVCTHVLDTRALLRAQDAKRLATG